MKVLTRALLIGAALSLAPALHAQSAIFDHVEYVSGKNDVDKKTHGGLVLEGVQLHFVHAGKPIFTIPRSTITKTSNTVENDPGSYGRKVLWGPLFASRHEEFVYVTTATPTGAEGFVFKVAKKSSPGIIAKIDCAAKQAKTDSGR